MNEVDFSNEAEKVFLEIEEAVDNYASDFDYDYRGDVLVIYHEGNEYMVVTRNHGQQQIWLAAGREAYHFVYENNHWLSSKDKEQNLLSVVEHYLDNKQA